MSVTEAAPRGRSAGRENQPAAWLCGGGLGTRDGGSRTRTGPFGGARPKAGFGKAETRHLGRAAPSLPLGTRPGPLGHGPAAPFPLLPSASSLTRSRSVSPGRFCHISLPVSKQALGERHRSVTPHLQGEGFLFSPPLVRRPTGTGRGGTAVEGVQLAAPSSLPRVQVW